MKYKARKFSQNSYDESDEFAKKIFTDFITKRNHKIIDSEENFKHDFITLKDNKNFYFELEIKSGYPFTSKDDFIFSSVSFLGRKRRLHDSMPFYYIIICKETKYAVFAYSDDIYKDEYFEKLEINTNNRSGYDSFYRMPKDLCKFFYIG